LTSKSVCDVATSTSRRRTLRNAPSACPEIQTPEDVYSMRIEQSMIQPQALFDTPTQELVGAKRILEYVDMTEFPLLSKLQIKFSTDFYLRALQREFDRLGDVIESVDLANVVAANDKERVRITVPKSANWRSFSASVRRTKWLSKAVDSVLPTSDDHEEYGEVDEQKEPDRSDVVEWFIRVLGEEDPNAFLRAVQYLGVPVAKKKLSPEELTAMADEGNFGRATERVIRRFLSSRGINILPSDRKMRMLGENAIIPETKKIKLNEVEYLMSHRPLEEVVASELSVVADEHLEWCDIVLGGDHGQGAFHFQI